jgi:hypothetical protein
MYEVYFSEKHGQRAVRAPSPTRDAALNLQDPQLPSRAASVRPGHFGQDQVYTLERWVSGLSHEPWRMATLALQNRKCTRSNSFSSFKDRVHD